MTNDKRKGDLKKVAHQVVNTAIKCSCGALTPQVEALASTLRDCLFNVVHPFRLIIVVRPFRVAQAVCIAEACPRQFARERASTMGLDK